MCFHLHIIQLLEMIMSEICFKIMQFEGRIKMKHNCPSADNYWSWAIDTQRHFTLFFSIPYTLEKFHNKVFLMKTIQLWYVFPTSLHSLLTERLASKPQNHLGYAFPFLRLCMASTTLVHPSAMCFPDACQNLWPADIPQSCSQHFYGFYECLCCFTTV